MKLIDIPRTEAAAAKRKLAHTQLWIRLQNERLLTLEKTLQKIC